MKELMALYEERMFAKTGDSMKFHSEYKHLKILIKHETVLNAGILRTVPLLMAMRIKEYYNRDNIDDDDIYREDIILMTAIRKKLADCTTCDTITTTDKNDIEDRNLFSTLIRDLRKITLPIINNNFSVYIPLVFLAMRLYLCVEQQKQLHVLSIYLHMPDRFQRTHSPFQNI